METEARILKLEEKVNNLEKQVQGLKKIVLDCSKITAIIEKAARSITIEPKKMVENLLKIQTEEPKTIAELPKDIIPDISVAKTPTELDNLIKLLDSKEWPASVDPSLIADENSEKDKEERAEAILEMIIDVHLENLNFLDFGCGEGHLVNLTKKDKPKISVGYDIVKQDKWSKWEKLPNISFTNNWDEVKQLGPYNAVLIYDVLDHIEISDDEIVLKMKEIKSLLALNGKIYIRCHPWSSRHGTHLYHTLNKAYAHIVFSDEEIAQMGHKQDKVRKIKHPVYEYNKLFANAGFKIQQGPTTSMMPTEQFFIKNKEVRSRIQAQYKDSIFENIKKGDFPSGPLDIQFVDYILI